MGFNSCLIRTASHLAMLPPTAYLLGEISVTRERFQHKGLMEVMEVKADGNPLTYKCNFSNFILLTQPISEDSIPHLELTTSYSCPQLP